MRLRARMWVLVLVVALTAPACASSGSSTPDAPVDQAAVCADVSAAVAEELTSFLAGLDTVSIQGFLESSGTQSLPGFRLSIAGHLAQDNIAFAQRCEGSKLDDALQMELAGLKAESPISQLIMDTVLHSGEPKVRDVVVEPDDDLGVVLAQLAAGSSITFTAGVFEIPDTVLIQRDLTIGGAGLNQTFVHSSAPDVALAVLEGASLDLSAFSLEHTGEVPATVVLSLGGSLRLNSVRVSGARVGSDGQGGNGVVMRPTPDGEGAGTPGSLRIENSEIIDNAVGGVVVSAVPGSSIASSLIARNEGCGICFFDTSAGVVLGNNIEANGIGVQVSDDASPTVEKNSFVSNVLVGVTVAGGSPTISQNQFQANGQAAIEVDGASTPRIIDNLVGSHPIGFSISGSAQPLVERNELDGVDVALQIGGTAAPTVRDVTIRNSSEAAFAASDDAAGMYENMMVSVPEGALGLFITDRATVELSNVELTGGALAASIGGDSSPWLEMVKITGSEVGLDVRDRATPSLSNLEVADTTTGGIVYSGMSAGSLVDSSFKNAGEIVMQIADTASPTIMSNDIDGGGTGLFLIGETTATVEQNTFRLQAAAIEVADSARPSITDNQLLEVHAVALSYAGASGGVAAGNAIFDPGGIGIQVAGTASPELNTNVIGGPVREPFEGSLDGPVDAAEVGVTTVGILYAEAGSGSAAGNQVFNFVVGIQVGDAGQPLLSENTIEGGAIGGVGVLYGGTAAGSATGNRTSGHRLGFQISEGASPTLEQNTIVQAVDAAILVTDTSTALIRGNSCAAGTGTIAVIDQATPTIGDNNCLVVR